MIYWLLIFSFDVNGDFVSKQEMRFADKRVCELVAAQYPAQVRVGTYYMPDRTKTVKTLCVSDDHHSGRKPDDGVPLD
jgi:hypothetical protein